MDSPSTPSTPGAPGTPGSGWPDRSRSPLLFAALALLAVVAIYLAVRPDAGGGGATRAATVEDVLRRERVLMHAVSEKYADARAELAPLLAKRPALEDLLRAAAIEVLAKDVAAAAPYLERMQALDADFAPLHYLRGTLAIHDGDFEAAEAALRAALAAAPDDLATKLRLGSVLEERNERAQAEALLRAVVDAGPDGGPWFMAALHRLSRICITDGRAEEFERLEALRKRYEELGFGAPSSDALDLGDLARLRAPAPSGATESGQSGQSGAPAPTETPAFELRAKLLPELAGVPNLALLDVNGERFADVVAWGPDGLQVALQASDGSFELADSPEPGAAPGTLFAGPVDLVHCFDLGNDDDIDYLIARGNELTLLEVEVEETEIARLNPIALGTLPSAPRGMLAADVDHEGDLDLVVVGEFGARLFRCDGANGGPDEKQFVGTFTEIAAEAGLPVEGTFTWVVSEDFDTDQDVDLLFGGGARLFLASNLRAERFEDVAARVFGQNARIELEPFAADLDADGLPDLFEPGASAALWRQQPDRTFAREARGFAAGAPLRGYDVDLDGTLDLLWNAGEGLARILLAAGQPGERLETIAGTPAPGPFDLADVDHERPLRLELARATAEGVELYAGTSAVGNATLMQWFGKRDNKGGVGAVVHIRAGELYRRIYWRGGQELVGFGPRPWIDIVRVIWPDGVLQFDVDREPGIYIDPGLGDLEQPPGQVGSCPFLYTWNGTTYEFISDVLGITPLGLPMGPGMMVPPDHDEYVLVRGDRLAAKDGFYELQFTEELREVTYLDRIRLEVVDHPVGTEIYPNERFCFPPFPEPHVHTVRGALKPVRAVDSLGRDWTAALAARDDAHTRPCEPYERQFLGLARPHWLELEYDAAALADAAKLRLVFTGWFYWTNASVNMASARTPGVDFVPPILQVPDPDGADGADGNWVDAGPPVGFPAGKPKDMVIDVTEILRRDDPRIRVFTTLALHWDAIDLAVDDDDAELRTTSLEPVSARLWRRGFSRLSEPYADGRPERFDWDALEPARWDQHPGLYTKLGETLPLVTEIDDMFVIMGAGEALTVRFDARDVPPLEAGWTRDFLVFLDGWAKDRDPNALEVLEVEPLPFHGMSGYPYGPDERFPDDERHRAWRAEWNTRPAWRWVLPLAPAREREWLALR